MDTEMILLKEDITRIESLGYKRGFFVEWRNGFYRLKNKEGRCVFYDIETGRCRIYKYRPLGCKIYPLIYDEEYGIRVDTECPYGHLITCQEIIEGIELLKLFLKKLERYYNRKVNWRLFRRSINNLLQKCKDLV